MVAEDAATVAEDATTAAAEVAVVVAEANTTLVRLTRSRKDCALALAPTCLIMGRGMLPIR